MATKHYTKVKKEAPKSNWKQTLPSQAHLVTVTVTGQCSTNPNIEKHYKSSFRPKPKSSGKPALQGNRSCSPSQEQEASHGCHHNHAPIFPNKEKGKSHRSILNVISRYQFCFGFWLIKWCTVLFRKAAYDPNKRHWPLRKQKPAVLLRLYQCTPVLAVCNHTSRQNNQSHWQFIANHLGNGTTASQKGIFTVTSPSSQLDSINTQTSNSQYIHSSQIQIPNCTSSTCRQSSPSNLTCQKSQNWSPQEQCLVCTTRLNRFFLLLFQTIQKGLQYTKNSPSIRTLATLHSSHYTTLYKCLESYCKQQRHHSCQNHNLQI